jgi:hypothetical protein
MKGNNMKTVKMQGIAQYNTEIAKQIQAVFGDAGFHVTETTQDGSYSYLRSVTIENDNGDKIIFSGGDSSNRLIVFVPEEPKKVIRFRIHGQIVGVPVDTVYEDQKDAQAAINRVDGSDLLDNTNLQIEEVEVEE